jgi:hypothetical protein
LDLERHRSGGQQGSPGARYAKAIPKESRKSK